MTNTFSALIQQPKSSKRPRVRAPQSAVKPSRADTNATLRKIVGDRFVDARKLNGWDQTEAADKFGYKNSTQLSLIEQGKRLPPHEVLIKGSEIYGVSVDFLLGLSDEPERDPKAAERQAAMRHVHGLVSSTSEQMIGLLLQYLAHGVPSVNTARMLLDVADDLALTVNRVRMANQKVFDEKLRGGAGLVNLADKTANACAQAREMLSRHERVTEFKIATQEKRAGVTRPLFDVGTTQ